MRLGRMRRAVVSSADWLSRLCPRPAHEVLFVTLTYRPGVRWDRRQISECLRHWRRELRQQRLRYVWVLELTKAGRPHYHVAIWVTRGTRLAKPDESGAWPWGASRIELARRPVGYLAKYASKGPGGQWWRLPKGARLYGAGGLERDGRAHVRWWLLPRYQRERCEVGDHVVRCKGGGWVSRTTGQWWPAWQPG